MSKRLFSEDKDAGISRYFSYDESSDSCTIETVQNVEPMVELAKANYNKHTEGRRSKWGNAHLNHVAVIPMVEFARMCIEGWTNDDKKLQAWANDPHHKHLRTRPGRV